MLVKFLLPVLFVAFAHAADPVKRSSPTRPVPHTLKCDSNEMEVEIEKKPLPYAVYSDLRLLDKKCLPTSRKGKFVFKFGLDECGTTVKTTPKEIIYRNEVLGKLVPKSKISHRIKDVRVTLKCSYPRTEKLTSQNIEPNQDKFRAASKEDGKYEFRIEMYGNNKFEKPFVKFPVKLQLREPLFFEVSVKSKRHQLAILAQSCYATPTKADTPPKHPLIEKNCPVDKKLKILPSPTENVERFEVETFRFNKDQKYFYIHCHVIACRGDKKDSLCATALKSCKKGIQKREFDDSNLETFKLTQGPLAVRDPEPQLDENLEQLEDQADETWKR